MDGVCETVDGVCHSGAVKRNASLCRTCHQKNGIQIDVVKSSQSLSFIKQSLASDQKSGANEVSLHSISTTVLL